MPRGAVRLCRDRRARRRGDNRDRPRRAPALLGCVAPARQRITIKPRKPAPVGTVAGGAHDGDDLLNRARIGRVSSDLCCVVLDRRGVPASWLAIGVDPRDRAAVRTCPSRARRTRPRIGRRRLLRKRSSRDIAGAPTTAARPKGEPARCRPWRSLPSKSRRDVVGRPGRSRASSGARARRASVSVPALLATRSLACGLGWTLGAGVRGSEMAGRGAPLWFGSDAGSVRQLYAGVSRRRSSRTRRRYTAR